MPTLPWQRLFLTATITLLSAGSVFARPTALYWEKIHVYHLAPTLVFAKLGLTHSTKNGLTRDGKKGVPDPTFPPGMTDIVPYDTERLLIVRGTTGGLSLFRTRVAAADVPAPPLLLHAELTRREEGADVPFGTVDLDGLTDGIAHQISLGKEDTARVYQITTRLKADGSVWVACRISLPLPSATANDGAAPEAVFTPMRVWTDPLSRKIRLGETAVFEDLASFRHTAEHKLGTSGTDTNDDYTLRVMLTAVPPQTAPTVVPITPPQTNTP
jgi:hypothetical protein